MMQIYICMYVCMYVCLCVPHNVTSQYRLTFTIITVTFLALCQHTENWTELHVPYVHVRMHARTHARTHTHTHTHTHICTCIHSHVIPGSFWAKCGRGTAAVVHPWRSSSHSPPPSCPADCPKTGSVSHQGRTVTTHASQSDTFQP